MVSTRQMSNVGATGNANPAGDGQSTSAEAVCPAKCTRHSSVITNVTANPAVAEPAVVEGAQNPAPTQHIFLLDLPHEILEKIFGFLTFKTIAHLRPVSHSMDRTCGAILNSTFQKLQKQMLSRFQKIKAKMPRRESARRNHPLACESDIVETLHMRLTLLQMSFGKHIERKHCCFFAGEILDEVYRILHYIKVTTKLARPYKVTDELFDLSTMAMEYFKEHIEPRLPEIAYFGSDFLDFTGTFSSGNTSKNYLCFDSSPLDGGSGEEQKGDESPSHTVDETIENNNYNMPEPLPQSNMVLRKRIRKIKQGMKRYNSQLTLLRQDLRTCKRKTAEQQKQIAEQQKQLAEQQKQTLEYATRLDENDKKNEETSRKFSTLLQELNKCKTELQYWRSKSPATPPVCKGCGTAISSIAPEDIQALVNQGVRPEGLGLMPDETFNADASNVIARSESTEHMDTESVEEIIEEDHNSLQTKFSPTGTKRKALETQNSVTPADNPENKKPRRISKGRCKRVKLNH